MIWLGTGPVKGFGITLAIGILTSVFCALFVSRMFLTILVKSGVNNLISLQKIQKSDPKEPIDFHRYRKVAFLTSWIVVGIGIFSVYSKKGNNSWNRFSRGEELVAGFSQSIDAGDLEESLKVIQHWERFNMFIDRKLDQAKVLVGWFYKQRKVSPVKPFETYLQTQYPDAALVEEGLSNIGGSVSEQIKSDAILSVSVALLGILLYVALRFEMGYAIGAVVATIHDILMTVGLFVLIGYLSEGVICSGQFTAPMLASILMIVGYSINDTIVVFDRIREELELNPVTNLRKIIIIAINRVLSRSVLTSFTTLLAATSLWIFGAGIINDFAFVFVIGILTGTFSSIFIASPIFYFWHRGDS